MHGPATTAARQNPYHETDLIISMPDAWPGLYSTCSLGDRQSASPQAPQVMQLVRTWVASCGPSNDRPSSRSSVSEVVGLDLDLADLVGLWDAFGICGFKTSLTDDPSSKWREDAMDRTYTNNPSWCLVILQPQSVEPFQPHKLGKRCPGTAAAPTVYSDHRLTVTRSLAR